MIAPAYRYMASGLILVAVGLLLFEASGVTSFSASYDVDANTAQSAIKRDPQPGVTSCSVSWRSRLPEPTWTEQSSSLLSRKLGATTTGHITATAAGACAGEVNAEVALSGVVTCEGLLPDDERCQDVLVAAFDAEMKKAQKAVSKTANQLTSY